MSQYMIYIYLLEKDFSWVLIYRSSGILNLSSYIVKWCFQILNEKLLVIINKSLFQEYFPIKWSSLLW